MNSSRHADDFRSNAKNLRRCLIATYNRALFSGVSPVNGSVLTGSTMSSKETVKWTDGQEYPLIKIDISSQSHPFYTGKQKIVDSGGRVDKFRRRYAK